MQSAKFHFDNVYWQEAYDLGPVTLYQIGDLHCNGGYEVPLHEQTCYEITYTISGEGYCVTDGKRIKVAENQVILNRPGQMHQVISSQINPLRYVYLGFWFSENHPDYAKYSQIKQFFDMTDNFVALDTQLGKFFFGAFGEIMSQGDMLHEMLKSYISQILVTAFRALSYHPHVGYSASHHSATEEQIVYSIINYLQDNAYNVNQLSNIGEKLGYSYPYLSQVFSRRMNCSIQVYSRQKLFARAVELMQEGKKITEIAALLGYSTVYSFSRAFTKHFGISPSRYREQLLKAKQANTENGD